MTTSHDEEMLSRLFEEIREIDERIDPPSDLEIRIMTKLSFPAAVRRPTMQTAGVAALGMAAALALGIGLAVWSAAARQTVDAEASSADRSMEQAADRGIPMFLGLRPDAREVLAGSGSVQVARVRVSRDLLADLGVVVDGDRVGEPMQADVLFGEDGLARAIRLVPVAGRTEW